jgi:transposase
MDTSKSRRRYSAELKAKVVAACNEPGASAIAVARAHDLNVSLVRAWLRCSGTRRPSPAEVTTRDAKALSLQPADFATFVPVQLQPSDAAAADIRLELRRGASTVIVSWPAQQAAACGGWLREWLA